jgi:N-acetylmuramoyl-L-alanine amidase
VIFLEDDYDQNYEGFNPSSPESFIGLTLLQEDYLDQSILLASNIQKNFTKKLKRKNRGVKQAGFWVLHNTYMPSVLVETGFITNKSEGDYLNSVKGKKEVSKSIFEAIIDYKSSLNRNVFLDDSETENQDMSSKIFFKVQIAAGSKKIALKSYNFRGLKFLSREKSDKLYRYFYGYTNQYNTAIEMKEEAISSGFKNAFVVAYLNGDKISIEKALKN